MSAGRCGGAAPPDCAALRGCLCWLTCARPPSLGLLTGCDESSWRRLMVERDYLPTDSIVCPKCGEPMNVLADTTRIRIWTRNGLMHKAKPFLRCSSCPHESVLSPAYAELWLGCMSTTPALANQLFSTCVVQDLCAPLSRATARQ